MAEAKIPYHFWTKLRSWEYWPAYITNIPVVFFWLWQAIRTGKLFFFSTVNPAVKTGGMMGDSKMDILMDVPPEFIPKSFLFHPNVTIKEDILNTLLINDIKFPIIAKPDVGERGLHVQKLESELDLEKYLKRANYSLIIQEYVNLPMEVTILCYRIPENEEAAITSVCVKEFLHVQGDGKATIRELIERDERAGLYLDILTEKWAPSWDKIPSSNEKIWLQPIGNHCKGTKFINANEMIDSELEKTFIDILDRMDGYYYGRFDMRCLDWESLKRGENFKILEFNGACSEPAHIYDPSFGVFKAYKAYWKQWGIMARIFKMQDQKGIQPISFSEAWQRFNQYFKYLKTVKS